MGLRFASWLGARPQHPFRRWRYDCSSTESRRYFVLKLQLTMKQAEKVSTYPSTGDHIYVLRSLSYTHHGRQCFHFPTSKRNTVVNVCHLTYKLNTVIRATIHLDSQNCFALAVWVFDIFSTLITENEVTTKKTLRGPPLDVFPRKNVWQFKN